MLEADRTATVAPMTAAGIARAMRSAMPLNHSRMGVGEMVARSIQVPFGQQAVPPGARTSKSVTFGNPAGSLGKSSRECNATQKRTSAAAESNGRTFLDPAAPQAKASSSGSLHRIGALATMDAIVGAPSYTTRVGGRSWSMERRAIFEQRLEWK
jgi:hypothetical protein